MPLRKGSSILLAGSGRVASELTKYLLPLDVNIYALSRTKPRDKPPGIQSIQADLTLSESLSCLKKIPFSHIVYSASADSYNRTDYEKTYIKGMCNLMQIMDDYHPKPQVCFISSTSVYGDKQGNWVHEDTPENPNTFAGEVLLNAETKLVEIFPNAIITRFGGIYGSGSLRLLEQVKNKTILLSRTHPLYVNRIHVQDCGAMIFHLLKNVNLSSKEKNLYIGTDHAPVDIKETAEWLAKSLDITLPAKCYTDTPITNRRGGNKRCLNSKICSTNFSFRFPTYQEGYSYLITSLTETKKTYKELPPTECPK